MRQEKLPVPSTSERQTRTRPVISCSRSQVCLCRQSGGHTQNKDLFGGWLASLCRRGPGRSFGGALFASPLTLLVQGLCLRAWRMSWSTLLPEPRPLIHVCPLKPLKTPLGFSDGVCRGLQWATRSTPRHGTRPGKKQLQDGGPWTRGTSAGCLFPACSALRGKAMVCGEAARHRCPPLTLPGNSPCLSQQSRWPPSTRTPCFVVSPSVTWRVSVLSPGGWSALHKIGSCEPLSLIYGAKRRAGRLLQAAHSAMPLRSLERVGSLGSISSIFRVF